MILFRTRPVIGRAIDPAEERALRDERFLARWKPVFELVGSYLSVLAFASAALLLGMMTNGVVGALIQHVPGPLQ